MSVLFSISIGCAFIFLVSFLALLLVCVVNSKREDLFATKYVLFPFLAFVQLFKSRHKLRWVLFSLVVGAEVSFVAAMCFHFMDKS